MNSLFDIEGFTGSSGAQYIRVVQGETEACVPRSQFALNERAARQSLALQGLPVIGKHWSKVLERVSETKGFPLGPVIEKVGWNGTYFALPDGTVFAPEGALKPFLAFGVQSRKCALRGSRKKWKQEVAAKFEGQNLATFVLAAAFMPPLLKLTDRVGNVGFEIVGPKGTGKSTLLHLVSSALGGVGQDDKGHYWVTLDTTYNALEDTMGSHSDLIALMDEANLLAADAPTRERSNMFRALTFKMGSGGQKSRYGAVAEPEHRLTYVTSSNEPLASLLGQTSESARAAADRLLTLTIDEERPFGVFDALPPGYASSSEFAQALFRSATQHHGHAIRGFLQQLVIDVAEDEEALRSRIDKYVQEFRKEAVVNLNNGSQLRVADAFGLVYAAGKLARRYGILPKCVNPAAAALHCYRLHIGSAWASTATFFERLRALVDDDRVVEVTASKSLPKAAVAFLVRRKEHTELLVPPENIKKIFPDWLQIKNSREVTDSLVPEGLHKKVKRMIGAKGPMRVYCFVLP